jgi:glucose-1-phosphate cytidylyltransferase
MMVSNEFSVFILCGGQGTRLREETEFRPKPMVKIGDRPILWHIMKIYDHYGFRDFVLCLGYKAEIIKDYFMNYRTHRGSYRLSLRGGNIEPLTHEAPIEDWRIALVDTGIETLTATRIKRALTVTQTQRFFLTYGDGVANVDIAALVEHHKKAGRLVTITAVRPSSRFGELDLRGDHVRSFQEKPQVGQGWINGGFMVFEREAFDVLPDAENASLESSVLETLSRQGHVSVYRHGGFWQCMDTYREMQLLEDLWQSGHAPWRLWSH